ncbi:cytoplasmic poly(A) polymerase Cid13 [Schizosaccharomyces pombe]|uniref:Poly(A) RNA polymerase cid13 n=1 Tax=Schizosaccharomyces pombe (strain 972 / ATCC 24843) TaxID=284812 RepID=CID13_SCHPO|nr:poly(A) polymerase Cid13 [Schizosaccharomyces pombe]Q9UT49.1 RecName: Full=Poly(A) RNA polymerase cid13; Short=PAP; AltName: Full=Caffeine-induced death protein 13; AltName: Full=Polynucleotide adenylyltransferase cid13 [Schizosaccharomyces pombe 972h-]CAB57438.1 poly(A) polymerase Cid13 [Schizosaccharomyces pombe]|eukprot:NP_593157.1 poly(A) polymerase Cid13 [Schizosaccharomyces pombe]
MDNANCVGGCKFETRSFQYRRRIPYSLGADPLPPVHPLSLKNLVDIDTDLISSQLYELYDSIILNDSGLERRYAFVQKLEQILKKEFPYKNIKTSLFGSTQSLLASNASDIDLCIITDPPQCAPTTCEVSAAFARNGLKKVVCISTAKVPIVKVWDSELQLSCDCNINKTISTLNTRLMRSYVLCDPRVRPLIVMIKYWAKRRCLNDAAEGGTLTSYTISCMVINFLQKRDPPILPSLQMLPHLQDSSTMTDGLDVSFFDDPDLVHGFGDKNEESLGILFVEFFRFFGYLFDYEHFVLSIRHGTFLSKRAKGWQFQLNNFLCVEEPFHTSRNLANTADEITMKGIQLEFRRVFRLLAYNCNVDDACSQFTFPSLTDTSFMDDYVNELQLEIVPGFSHGRDSSDTSCTESPPEPSHFAWAFDPYNATASPYYNQNINSSIDYSSIYSNDVPAIPPNVPYTFVDPYTYACYINNNSYLPPSYMDFYTWYNSPYPKSSHHFDERHGGDRHEKNLSNSRRYSRNKFHKKKQSSGPFQYYPDAFSFTPTDNNSPPSNSSSSEVVSPVSLHSEPVLSTVQAFKS